jgi:threonine efflux protein
MNFLFFAVAHFLAVLSPGQTFLGMANLAIKVGFWRAIPFAFGVLIGNLVFSFIAVFGLSEVIFKNEVLSMLFYMMSGAYLCYFSFKLFLEEPAKEGMEISPRKAFFTGLLVELSNPKSVFFTASLVAMVITPESTLFLKFFVIFWLTFVSLIYEVAIIWLFSLFRKKLLRYLKYFNRCFAVILLIFGVRLMLWGVEVAFS